MQPLTQAALDQALEMTKQAVQELNLVGVESPHDRASLFQSILTMLVYTPPKEVEPDASLPKQTEGD